MNLLERVKEAQKNAQRVHVPISEIRRYEGQPRKYFDRRELELLAKSIQLCGQVVAGIIHKNPGSTPYEFIDGERRGRAIELIPENERPLYKADLITADEDVLRFLISGVANVNRSNFRPLEMAEGIDTNLKNGFDMPDIAAVFGMSVGWAYEIHGLIKLHPNVRKLLSPEIPKKERLPLTAAINLAKIDPRLQMRLAQRVLNKEVPLSGLRGAVIETAHKAGVAVRTRTVDPNKQWASFKNRIRQAAHVLKDAESRLDGGQLRKYLTERKLSEMSTRADLSVLNETLLALINKLEK